MSRHFELINYSEFGSCVNGVVYACDVRRGAAEPAGADVTRALRDIVRHRDTDPIRYYTFFKQLISHYCAKVYCHYANNSLACLNNSIYQVSTIIQYIIQGVVLYLCNALGLNFIAYTAHTNQ